jgi:acid phosphatase
MRDPPASIPEHWMMCKAARNFRAAVAGLTGLSEEGTNASLDGSMPFTKRVERMDGTSIEGEWYIGFLLPKGCKI